MSNIPSSVPTLNGKWDMYYHLPQDKNWELSSYKSIMRDIDNVAKVALLGESINEKVVQHCMLFVMRKNITPMWEDEKNRNGGCFSFKVSNKHVYEVWRSLLYGLCGESLFNDTSLSKHANGITISPKRNFCIIKIWLDNTNIKDPELVVNIDNLQKQGCLFKKHEPEF